MITGTNLFWGCSTTLNVGINEIVAGCHLLINANISTVLNEADIQVYLYYCKGCFFHRQTLHKLANN